MCYSHSLKQKIIVFKLTSQRNFATPGATHPIVSGEVTTCHDAFPRERCSSVENAEVVEKENGSRVELEDVLTLVVLQKAGKCSLCCIELVDLFLGHCTQRTAIVQVVADPN